MIQFQQIEDDLLKFIKYQALGGRPMSPTTDLLASDILDSLLLTDLTIHIESAYEIQIPEPEISPQHFRSAACLARLVMSKILVSLDAPSMLCRELGAHRCLCKEKVELDPDMFTN